MNNLKTLVSNAQTIINKNDYRIWVQSDLQLSDPKTAKEVLTTAVDDILDLNLGIDAIWCLGDALAGKNSIKDLEDVADMTVKQLARLDCPVCYVMGNHELDLYRSGVCRFPLFELAQDKENWHTAKDWDRPFFARKFGDTLVLFSGNHASKDGTWMANTGSIPKEDAYPYSKQDFVELRDCLDEYGGPIISAGHSSYPGGQRASDLFGQLLPLPDNVKLHVYGHAHIGDMVWNKDNPWQRNNPVEGQELRQFNISALENLRSPGIHSAIIDINKSEPKKLRIRCHQEKLWMETFCL